MYELRSGMGAADRDWWAQHPLLPGVSTMNGRWKTTVSTASVAWDRGISVEGCRTGSFVMPCF